MKTEPGDSESAGHGATSPWDAILSVALRTPSPHNTQPWRVRVHNSRSATVYMERARMLPDEDITGHFLQCAMGMFVEAVRIVASNAGYLLRQTRLPGDARDALIPFAKLELEPGAEASVYSNNLLLRRATSRLASNRIPIPSSVTSRLREFEANRGQQYHQIDDSTLIEKLVRENIRAVFHDLNVRSYHDEIARWFRYSDAEANAKADGLDYRCMRVRPMELRVMRRVPQVLRWPVSGALVRRLYRAQLGRFQHIGMISGPFFNDHAADAGAFLMRFWLELSRENLYIHPFGNLVTNMEARAKVRALTGIENVWLVFRVGHTGPPPRSYRRALREVLFHG